MYKFRKVLESIWAKSIAVLVIAHSLHMASAEESAGGGDSRAYWVELAEDTDGSSVRLWLNKYVSSTVVKVNYKISGLLDQQQSATLEQEINSDKAAPALKKGEGYVTISNEEVIKPFIKIETFTKKDGDKSKVYTRFSSDKIRMAYNDWAASKDPLIYNNNKYTLRLYTQKELEAFKEDVLACNIVKYWTPASIKHSDRMTYARIFRNGLTTIQIGDRQIAVDWMWPLDLNMNWNSLGLGTLNFSDSPGSGVAEAKRYPVIVAYYNMPIEKRQQSYDKYKAREAEEQQGQNPDLLTRLGRVLD